MCGINCHLHRKSRTTSFFIVLACTVLQTLRDQPLAFGLAHISDQFVCPDVSAVIGCSLIRRRPVENLIIPVHGKRLPAWYSLIPEADGV